MIKSESQYGQDENADSESENPLGLLLTGRKIVTEHCSGMWNHKLGMYDVDHGW